MSWPAPGAKIQAKAAIRHLPLAVRKCYHPEYRITFNERDGEFAGLVCNGCNHWHGHGHGEGCPVPLLLERRK